MNVPSPMLIMQAIVSVREQRYERAVKLMSQPANMTEDKCDLLQIEMLQAQLDLALYLEKHTGKGAM